MANHTTRAQRINARHDKLWASMLNLRAADEKTVAERQWQNPKLAPAPQQPCDHGLFGDDKDQLDLLS